MSTQPTRLAAVLLLVPLLFLPACQSQSQSGELQIIELAILEVDGLLVDGEQTSLEDLPATMEQVVDLSRSRVIIRVSCANELPMGRLHAVQNELRSQGLFNMSYRTDSDEDLTLVLPPIGYREQLGEIPVRHFANLHIAASGKVTLEGNGAGYDELEEKITDRLAGDEYLIVSIKTDPEATYGDFMRVFGAAKQANAQRIHLNGLS